ncbi:MAG: polyprenyl synthetase family protein [Planctomycetes bacterium]|nr:polyprenyl synthetase family protein [Planctomycetota bacterium]
MSKKTSKLNEILGDRSFLKTVEKELLNVLSRSLPSKNGIFPACKYSVTGNAKRIRPLLMKRFCDSFHKDWKNIVPAAVMVELIHNFSLVHDDLPCMDDSDYRRGKLSCHKKFSEATAVLTGDLLLSAAFGALKAYKPSLGSDIASIASKCVNELIEGQYQDLNAKNDNFATRIKLYEKKTSSLFILSSLTTMKILNLNKGRKFDHFGRILGILFQAVDDLLDCTGQKQILKKLADGSYIKTKRLLKSLNLPDEKPISSYIDFIYSRAV